MPPIPVTTLTDKLVTSLLQSESSSKRLRRARDTFAKRLKHHNYLRTNQFEVSTKLEGLVEKFRVLNRDDLADELYPRMKQLEGHQQKWIPDILDLLLHISDNPVKNSNVQDLEALRPKAESPAKLRWVDIDRDDPFDRSDPIWRDTVFTGYSSEEDIDIPPQSSPPLVDSTEQLETPEIPTIEKHALRNASETEELVNSLMQAQFWNHNVRGLTTISEADMVRETIFVLLGLPSSIYWRVGDTIEVDKRFVLSHASHESLLDFERKVGELVLRIDLVRRFDGQSQTVPYMQVFHDGVHKILEQFDWELSTLQSNILTGDLAGSLSLLHILQIAREKAMSIFYLAELVREIRPDEPVHTLERLFNLSCRDQALGNKDGFETQKSIFVRMFQRYLRSLQKQIDEGVLPDNFQQSLPYFLQSFSDMVKQISRTRVVLSDLQPSKPWGGSQVPEFSVISSDLVPFEDTFRLSLSKYIETQLTMVSVAFKKEINSYLTRDLDVLQHIYFARNAAITTALDRIIFHYVENDDSAWNDRFILSDHVQSAYGKLRGIDTQSLTVHPNPKSRAYTQTGGLCVSRLGNMSIIYYLKPPVSTIIPRSTLKKYQSVSTLLLQLRWAKLCSEGPWRHKMRSSHPSVVSMSQLLLFSVNTLYDHFTSYSIEALSIRMSQTMKDARDLDEMVHAHESFLTDLEDQCLLSQRLAPLHDALMSILGLCGDLSDIVTQKSKIPTLEKWLDPDHSSSDEDEYETGGPDTLQEAHNGPRDDQVLAGRLSNMKARFEKEMAFVIAGLKGVSRVQNSGWDVLAEKLDWETVKRSRDYI